MPAAPRVLIADDDVSDLLVLRRLLRDTPYSIDTVRSASQAVMALAEREYAAMVAAKAGHSSGHGARVSALAGVLAKETGLSGAALDAVEDAALVHDVGELALDATLLQVRRALTEAERAQVRHHVESSYQIVR